MTKNLPQYTIAVTGLNAIDSPGSGMAVIRSLKEAKSFNTKIIGLAYETLEPGVYMQDLIDKTYRIPLPSDGQENLFNRIEEINNKEKIDLIIPNFDSELYNFIKLEGRIKSKLDINLFLPTRDQFEESQKINLSKYARKYKINSPKTKKVNLLSELSKKIDKFDYPVVVKGKFYDASIAHSFTQAKNYYTNISSEWGLPVILQEFAQGTEVNVCALGDGEGNTIGAVPIRKLFITKQGKAWAGITIEDPELIKLTHHLIKETKWKGPLELELIKSKDDIYSLIEINPRFPAWCYLTFGAGQNQIESLVKLAMEEKTETLVDYVVGKMFIRYSEDMIVDLKQFEKIATLGEL
jgi:carbamoyl-phosphate synthase large subunit